jgi:hypothetical protein
MSPLLSEGDPAAPGRGTRRIVFMAAAVAVTGLLAWLALYLGAWAFDYRRYAAHNRRLQELLSHEPRIDQVVEALQDHDGTPLLASPEDEAALRAEAALRGGAHAAEIVENGRRFPHARVFLAGDMVYFIHFDDAGVMRAFTCVSR